MRNQQLETIPHPSRAREYSLTTIDAADTGTSIVAMVRSTLVVGLLDVAKFAAPSRRTNAMHQVFLRSAGVIVEVDEVMKLLRFGRKTKLAHSIVGTIQGTFRGISNFEFAMRTFEPIFAETWRPIVSDVGNKS